MVVKEKKTEEELTITVWIISKLKIIMHESSYCEFDSTIVWDACV